MSMKHFDENIKRALKKDESDKSFLDFDFNSVEFLGCNMALRNKTSNSIFGTLDKKMKKVEENDER